MTKRVVSVLTLLFGALVAGQSLAASGDPVLTIQLAGQSQKYTAKQLLNRPDVVDLTIVNDVAYLKTMRYRAVPLLNLLGPTKSLTFDTLEAAATDGYVSQLPMAAILGGAQGKAKAWIAIEPPSKPWPKLPKKKISAGPFFLVWQYPERSGIDSGKWPYALAELRAVRSPMQRWPQIRVADSVGADAPARRGMQAYIKHCLACHKIDGGGESIIGPDLLRPMSPLDYMTVNGLKALVRDPAAVRTWPKQEMSGISKEALSDKGLDDLLAYLRHMRDK